MCLLPSISGKESKRLTSYQKNTLKKEFKANPFPKIKKQHQLARSLNVSARRISCWYSWMRFEERKKNFVVQRENS